MAINNDRGASPPTQRSQHLEEDTQGISGLTFTLQLKEGQNSHKPAGEDQVIGIPLWTIFLPQQIKSIKIMPLLSKKGAHSRVVYSFQKAIQWEIQNRLDISPGGCSSQRLWITFLEASRPGERPRDAPSEPGVEKVRPEGKPDLDRIAQQVKNLFKFRNFYDQMDFSGK